MFFPQDGSLPKSPDRISVRLAGAPEYTLNVANRVHKPEKQLAVMRRQKVGYIWVHES